MQVNPCAKINLGLNIVNRRPDGYHDLETVFMPIPLFDSLTVKEQTDNSYPYDCQLTVTGDNIECEEQKNLAEKLAYATREQERYNAAAVGRLSLASRSCLSRKEHSVTGRTWRWK